MLMDTRPLVNHKNVSSTPYYASEEMEGGAAVEDDNGQTTRTVSVTDAPIATTAADEPELPFWKVPKPFSYVTFRILSILQFLACGGLMIGVRVLMLQGGCTFDYTSALNMKRFQQTEKVCDMGAGLESTLTFLISQGLAAAGFGILLSFFMHLWIVIAWLIFSVVTLVAMVSLIIAMIVVGFPFVSYTLPMILMTSSLFAGCLNLVKMMRDTPAPVKKEPSEPECAA